MFEDSGEFLHSWLSDSARRARAAQKATSCLEDGDTREVSERGHLRRLLQNVCRTVNVIRLSVTSNSNAICSDLEGATQSVLQKYCK